MWFWIWMILLIFIGLALIEELTQFLLNRYLGEPSKIERKFKESIAKITIIVKKKRLQKTSGE
jgi:hypothetical protein